MLARKLGDVIMWCTLIVSTLIATLSFGLRSYIPRLFTSDQQVIDIAVQMSPLFCLFVIVDALHEAFFGILRGIKRQGQSVIGVVVGMWLVGIPLACVLAFYPPIDRGIFGIWIGNNAGYFLMDVVFLYLWVSFDWDQQTKSTVDEKQVAPSSSELTLLNVE